MAIPSGAVRAAEVARDQFPLRHAVVGPLLHIGVVAKVNSYIVVFIQDGDSPLQIWNRQIILVLAELAGQSEFACAIVVLLRVRVGNQMI